MPPTPPFVAIALGSNVGARERHLSGAIDRLSDGLVLGARRGGLYESSPLAAGGGGDYLNTVLVGHSHLEPEPLLAVLKFLEAQAGRRRGSRWSARPLDLDLLLHGPLESRAPELTLPHPALRQRPFVLAPLADAAPGLELPPDAAPVELLLDAIGGRRSLRRRRWSTGRAAPTAGSPRTAGGSL